MRPSYWAVMLVVGGFVLLKLGHDHEWFLGPLASGTLHNQTYFLAWACVGAAYSLLASFVWLRGTRQSGRVRRVLGLFFLVTLMMTGSQVAARKLMHPISVVIVGFKWDQYSQEFVVYIGSTNAAVTNSRIRGDLQAIVSVEGLWWSSSEKKSLQPLLASEVEEFAVGAPDLLGQRLGTHELPWYSRFGASKRGGECRVPWKPRRVGSDSAYVVRVNAAIVNREGKRVGWEATPQITGSAYAGTYVGSTALPPTRKVEFVNEGWAWISNPDRNRAPFRLKTPPPQSGDRPVQK